MVKKIAFIVCGLLFSIMSCKEESCVDINIHSQLKGNYKLIQKNKFYTEVPLSLCDSTLHKIILEPNEDGFWNFCSLSGETIKRKIKFYNTGGPVYCEPRMKYQAINGDDIYDVSGSLVGDNLYVSYRYYTNADTLFHLVFEKE